MEEQKKQIVMMIEECTDSAMINYLYNLILSAFIYYQKEKH